jgi:antitoxin CptB
VTGPDASPDAIPDAIGGRLRWQCRRGMLELDCILERYLDDHYAQVDAAEQQQFQVLLTAQDPELQQWLLNGQPHPDPAFHALITRIRGI